ncbi:MAG: DUF4919 domain-containing protein [Vicingaceae bacterium]
MKKASLYSFLSIIFFAFCQSLLAQDFSYKRDFQEILERSRDSSDVLFHNKLMKKYQANDTTLSNFEMLALMINYTQSEHYTPYAILDSETAIAELNGIEDHQRAIQLCDSLLETHPFNQAILFEKALAHYELDQADSAQFYRYRFNQIMDAMSYSGKGTSTENAIFSLGSKDGHRYIVNRLSQQITKVGAGQDDDGNMIDIIETVDEGEGIRIMHFQIQHAVNTLFEQKK